MLVSELLDCLTKLSQQGHGNKEVEARVVFEDDIMKITQVNYDKDLDEVTIHIVYY